MQRSSLALAIPSHKPVSTHRKALYLVLAAICLMVGLLGLLIPIIPGILFLALSLLLLGKVSERIHRWIHSKPSFSRFVHRIEHLDRLTVRNKMKATGLLALQSFVGFAAFLWRGVWRGVRPVHHLYRKFKRSDR